MKEAVRQMLEEYEEDCNQQKKLFEEMNSLLKTLRAKKDQLLSTLVEVSEEWNPTLKALPKSGRLVHQEQLLKSVFAILGTNGVLVWFRVGFGEDNLEQTGYESTTKTIIRQKQVCFESRFHS